ncbi:MAG: DMT family transporter [Actinomycetota bacterium]|nr:DMT family transporter [Actinomycetota bacterium]
MLVYIVIASAQSVALNRWLSTTNVYLVVGLSFIVVVGLFGTVGLRTARVEAYRFVLTHRRLLVALNVAAVFNWLFYFLAVKYLPPAVAVTLTQGIGPLSMTAYSIYRGREVSRVTRACHGVIFVAAALMCGYVVQHRITTDSHSRATLVLAIGAAVICSVSITATIALSKTFAEAKVPASVVLSVRFPLLILTCLAVLPTQNDVHVDARIIGIVFGIALIGIATSSYFLQRGVELAPPLAVSTCLALSPMVVFAIDWLKSDSTANPVLFALIVGIVVVSAGSIVYDGTRLRGQSLVKVT